MILWDQVIEDMRARDRLGRERYGRPLEPHNGRDPLWDAYEEALDLAVYLRQAIYERDNPKQPAMQQPCTCGHPPSDHASADSQLGNFRRGDCMRLGCGCLSAQSASGQTAKGGPVR